MTDTPPTPTGPVCCVCPTVTPATVRTRIIPRRTLEPLSDEMRHATAWPDSANPFDVFTCGGKRCRDEVRSAARSILETEALGEDVDRIELGEQEA